MYQFFIEKIRLSVYFYLINSRIKVSIFSVDNLIINTERMFLFFLILITSFNFDRIFIGNSKFYLNRLFIEMII